MTKQMASLPPSFRIMQNNELLWKTPRVPVKSFAWKFPKPTGDPFESKC